MKTRSALALLVQALLLGRVLMWTPHTALADSTDFQSWAFLSATATLDERNKWFSYTEVQPRLGDDSSRLERLIIRPALGYNLSQKVSLFLGYAWTPTFMNSSYQEDFRNENRIWEQILVRDSRWGIDWQHRLRQEQRMLADTSGVSNRTRYLLRGSYGIGDSIKWGLTAYNEIFVNLNSVENGPTGGFDRDRFFVGPYITQGAGRYELGYVGEIAQRFDEDGGRMINGILVAAMWNFE